MRITNITTTLLAAPGYRPIQDATMAPPRSQTSDRSALFVHVHTDAGVEGLGFGAALPAVRSVVETNLKELLIGEDPFATEKHWEAMFWEVRGYGRKGIAFCAISAIDVALWDLKAKAVGLPLYQLLGPYRDAVLV